MKGLGRRRRPAVLALLLAAAGCRSRPLAFDARGAVPAVDSAAGDVPPDAAADAPPLDSGSADTSAADRSAADAWSTLPCGERGGSVCAGERQACNLYRCGFFGPQATCRPCGAVDTNCCAGNQCYDGSVCVQINVNDGLGYFCRPTPVKCANGISYCDCGDVGEACCEFLGRPRHCVGNGVVCAANVCVKCGDLGEPCCLTRACTERSSPCRAPLRCTADNVCVE